MTRIHAHLSLLVVTLIVGACASDPTTGYTFAPTHDKGVSSVAIRIFQNETFDQGVGAELAEALTKEIQRRTGWAVTSSSRADRILVGTVTDSKQRLLAVDRETGLGQQLAVSITVDFQFSDARSGDVLLAREKFTASSSYVPTIVAGERRGVGRHGAVQSLASSIVDELQGAW